MVNIEISKKNLCLGVLGFAVLFGFGFVIAAWDTTKTMWHSGDDVRIDINSQDKSLQEAITDGDFTVGTGDITAVNAGIGLSGGGTSGSVTLNADLNSLQKRVLSSCPAGSSIRAISSTGTVTCEVDDTGGGVGGSGSTGRIAYWSGSNTLSSDSALIWNPSSERIETTALFADGFSRFHTMAVTNNLDIDFGMDIKNLMGDGVNFKNPAWTAMSICTLDGNYKMLNYGGCPDGWTKIGSTYVLLGS